jgi:hypothetical protein
VDTHSVSSVCFFVLVNSTPTGFFNSYRDLRHGDPMSSFLFIIIMDAFNKMIFVIVNWGFLLRFSLGSRNDDVLNISYMLFEDEFLIFCDPILDHLCYFLCLFLCF